MEILKENWQNPNTSKSYSEKNDLSTSVLFTERVISYHCVVTNLC